MTTTLSPTRPEPSSSAPAPFPATGRWALAGALAGVVALVGLLATGPLSPEVDLLADNDLVARHVIDKEGLVWLFQATCSGAALGVAVFAAGLRRRLAAQCPASSLVPSLAAIGLGSVVVMLLVGGGISTELFWSLMQDHGDADPDSIGAMLAILNTMAYVWAGAGLAAGAVAVAALRQGAMPRWIGWFSAVMAGLIGLVQLVPLQYLAGFAGTVWLVVVGIGLARDERRG
jgi:hypothetical protein